VELVVVHDKAFCDALPVGVPREFHDTLPHSDYMALLATCDLALLPLAETPFNRLKSDLKFIECCAAGVVPVCSPTVYGDEPRHGEIGLFASTPEEWCRALLTACSDSALLAERRARGLAYVNEERMHSHQAAARASFYLGLMSRREELESQRRARLRAMASP
jgi:hypothetical protein